MSTWTKQDVGKEDSYHDVGTKLDRLAKAQGVTTGDFDTPRTRVRNDDIPGICRTCEHATIVTRGQEAHRVTMIRCGMLSQIVPHDIMECTEYWQRGQMSLREMGELAWYIDAREGPPSAEGRGI